MEFEDLTIDSLLDTGALPSATSEADLEQIKQIAPRYSWAKMHQRNFKSWCLTEH